MMNSILPLAAFFVLLVLVVGAAAVRVEAGSRRRGADGPTPWDAVYRRALFPPMPPRMQVAVVAVAGIGGGLAVWWAVAS